MGGLGTPEIILIMAALAILFLPAYLGYVAGCKRTIGGPAGLLLGLFFSYIGLLIVYLLPVIQPAYYDFGHRTSSSADEIMKYKKLYDSGAITEQEYNTQKARILNSNR